ncbi:serine kinase of HPr protein (carbohydrate metabolism regulator) [Bradyrhizobium sp. LM6.10]
MSEGGPSIHASAVKVGDLAVLIRGPSGSGKSRLAFDLIMAGRSGVVERAVLVGDDRVHLATVGREIEVRPSRTLAGLIEIRGLGIRRCDFVEHATVGLVVDLDAADAERAASGRIPENKHFRCRNTANPSWPRLFATSFGCCRLDHYQEFIFR